MIHARDDYNRIQDPENRIPVDEPVFLIRAQDNVSGDAVREWARLNIAYGGDIRLSKMAIAHAKKMDAWHTKKKADL